MKNKKLEEEQKDLLDLRWEEEVAFYAAMNRCRIKREKLPNGNFEYRVQDRDGDILLTIESARNVMFSPRRKRRSRR